ncbi:MAG: lamin tail domain-containing protein [Salibacteraceae bacterium]
MKKILSSLFVFAIGIGSAFSQLVITEISYNAQTQNSQGKLGGVEYLEIYNNSGMAFEMKGVNIPQTANNGMNFTFPAMLVPAGDYIIITNDSIGMQTNHNLTAYEYNGFILNAGYAIVLNDSNGNQIDSVRYENTAPWPGSANGDGASIELCDVNNDNTVPQEWKRSVTFTGITNNNRKIYGTPAAANACPNLPSIDLSRTAITIDENDGNVRLSVNLEGFNGSASSVNVTAVNGSGDKATDIVFGQTSVSFQGTFDEESFISFDVVDDTVPESDETIYFIISAAVNGTILNDSILVTINEDPNDNPVTRQMKLIGVTDAEAGGATRLIEVEALDNIADISIYGIGSANATNQAGGTDGVEWNFPAISVTKGERLYLGSDSADFFAFYGFYPNFVDGRTNQQGTVLSYNGDDAIELFENDRLIDTYGDADVDGTGTAWEYVNGWGKRVAGTGPDGDTFVQANWTYGGLEALTGYSTNDSCSVPYPFEKDTTSVNTIVVHQDVLVYPNPVNNTLNIAGIKNAEEVIIRDLLGNTIATKTQVDSDLQIDVSEYKAGVYFIQVIGENQEVSVQRFVKN